MRFITRTSREPCTFAVITEKFPNGLSIGCRQKLIDMIIGALYSFDFSITYMYVSSWNISYTCRA